MNAGTFLAIALGVAGCLGAEPPPVKRLGDAGVVTPGPDLDADPGEGASDLASDAAVSEVAVEDGGVGAWVGTWAFVSGSSGVNCAGTISVAATKGFLSIAAGPGAGQLTVQESGCAFSFALVGATATSDPPNQMCAAWAIPTIPVWTLTLKADGTLLETLGGQVPLNGESCMVSGMSTLVRQ